MSDPRGEVATNALAADATIKPGAHEEVEVTPAMIEAGKIALASYRPYFDLEEDGVVAIYKAMVNARKADR